MYHYIVDQTRIPTRNFDRLLGEVYGYLTEHQISGEVHRVTRLRNIPELVETALRSGARTIVAIGDDQTFLQLVELLAETETVVLGYIPLDKRSPVAEVLGIGGLNSACASIAKRRLQEFDLGLVNRNYFFTKVDFGLSGGPSVLKPGFFAALAGVSKLKVLSPLHLKISVDDNFSLTANIIAGSLINARPANAVEQDEGAFITNPTDGLLDLLLVEKMSSAEMFRYRKELAGGFYEHIPGTTILHGQTFEIEGPKNMQMAVEHVATSRSSATISISDKKLRVIAGKRGQG